MSTAASLEDLSNTIVEVTEAKNVDKMKKEELKAELLRRKLKKTGRKSDLLARLKAALLVEEAKEVEDGDDEDEESEGESDTQNDDSVGAAARGFSRKVKERHQLTFKNIEGSMQTFSGDSTLNVNHWLEEFEEMGQLCEWTDIPTEDRVL